MKIVIPAKEKSMYSLMADRFARAEYFAVINKETGDVEWIDNTITEAHGVGPKVIQFLIDMGVHEFKGAHFEEIRPVL